jgi:lipoyl-dependent peroxiredoxin subunit C
MSVLTIGHQFPAYRLTALIGGDLSKVDAQQPGACFTTISSDDHPGKWRVVFFWPKDFTFVCPTEIAAFGKLNDEFEDREAQILGVSIDSEFVHFQCRAQHQDLKRLPFPMLSDIKRELAQATAPLQPGRGGTRAYRVRRAGVHALRPNGWRRPWQPCAAAVALPENDWLH